MDEDELRAVTIGEPKRLDGPVLLAEPDPAWPALYEREAARIRALLGERALAIEHVGSTSVPGLIAKPIIDIALVVENPADEAAYVPALEGYTLRIRTPQWEQHRMLKGPDTDVNLHVFGPGSAEVGRMLRFRDRLRSDPAARERYAAAKRELAARTWDYVQSYADAKSAIVEALLAPVLGIDLAAAPERTYACALDDRLRATLYAGCDDDTLLELMREREKVGIDAPFGWPRPFLEALNGWREGRWPGPERAPLVYRATDLAVMPVRRPLSVSTDRLGVTALRCAHLLASTGEPIDRTGAGKYAEIYPAGALKVWDLPLRGYKTGAEARAALIAALREALPIDADWELLARSHDAFDALIAALVTRAALLGLTAGPPPELHETAMEEGWIHLPRPESLGRL